MPYSTVSYTGDGSTTDFIITWNYLDTDHITVKVDDLLTTDGSSLYEFSLVNSTTARVVKTSDSSAVEAGKTIELLRSTPITSRAVTFSEGSALRTADLNKNSDFLLYGMQETLDTVDVAATNSANAASTAAAASAAEALISENAAAASAALASSKEVLTNADTLATAADVVATNADVVTTGGFVLTATNKANDASLAASTATTQAAAASSSAADALVSENAAAASAASITTQETNAAASASAASTSETNAAASASTASAKEALTNADAIATAADVVSTNADVVSTNADAATATTKAGEASSSASTAQGAASTATTKASEALSSANAASTSETNAAAHLDSFQDQYLGSASSDPSTDLDGDTLVEGTLYWNSTTDKLKAYNGSSWDDATGPAGPQGDPGTNAAEDTIKFGGATKAEAVTGGVNITGDLAVTGTVDGRDVDADGTKLDGIASGATSYSADQTLDTTSSPTFGGLTTTGNINGRDIGVDGTKLDGIASGATSYSANQTVDTTSSPTFAAISVTGNVDGRDVSADGTKLDGIATNANYITNTNQLTNGAGFSTYSANQALDSSSNVTFNNISTTGTVDGRDVASDGTKLDGIDANANYITNTNQLTNGAGFSTYSANQTLDTTSNPSFGTVYCSTVDLGDWTITESGGELKFAHSGTNKFKIDSSGNMTVVGNITAYGSI